MLKTGEGGKGFGGESCGQSILEALEREREREITPDGHMQTD
jgi:hypothetical protein